MLASKRLAFAFACGFGFALALDAGFQVVLATLDLGQDACLLNLFLEALQGAFNALTGLQLNFRHYLNTPFQGF